MAIVARLREQVATRSTTAQTLMSWLTLLSHHVWTTIKRLTMAKDSITLSSKYGVNPSLLKCPICGKDMGIALLGRLKGDKEAPREMNSNELCDNCKKQYITLLLVEKQEPKPNITGMAYIKREVVSKDFQDKDCLYMLESEFRQLQHEAK